MIPTVCTGFAMVTAVTSVAKPHCRQTAGVAKVFLDRRWEQDKSKTEFCYSQWQFLDCHRVGTGNKRICWSTDPLFTVLITGSNKVARKPGKEAQNQR